MNTTSPEVEQAKAELRREFPGWSIIVTNRDRWWATRNPERDESGKAVDHAVTAVDAETAGQLRARLTEAIGK